MIIGSLIIGIILAILFVGIDYDPEDIGAYITALCVVIFLWWLILSICILYKIINYMYMKVIIWKMNLK